MKKICLVKIFCVLLSFHISYSFNAKFSKTMRYGCTIFGKPVYNEEGELDRIGMKRLYLLTKEEYSGPGALNEIPTTAADEVRGEVSQFVLSFSILWLTIVTKLKDFYSERTKMSTANSKYIELASGVKYTEVISDTKKLINNILSSSSPSPSAFSSSSSAAANDQSITRIQYKLFYNGLQIGRTGKIHVQEVPSVNDSNDRMLVKNKVEDDDPFPSLSTGLLEGIHGMKIGSKRKISLPPSLAFGSTGFYPYIPADVSVLLEAEMQYIPVDVDVVGG